MGTCYLTGHGVSQVHIDEIFQAAQAFFALPEPDRLPWIRFTRHDFAGTRLLGVSSPAADTTGVRSFDIAPERPEQPVQAEDPPWLRLIGPNQWPAAMPALRPIVLGWQAKIGQLGQAVLRAFAQGLGRPGGLLRVLVRRRSAHTGQAAALPRPTAPRARAGGRRA